MKHLLSVYKPQGLTPLQTINLVKQHFPEFEKEKIGFAGRLDPLAHGVLLLMIGEETTKQKDHYLNLLKAYEFEIVFGAATDTYDVLGIVTKQTTKPMPDNSVDLIKEFVTSKIGKHKQLYPPFSSKTVAGKPLFWWAKNNKLHQIKIPQKEIEIFAFQLIKTNTLSAEKLKKEIFRQINLVQGDFRQEEIKNTWNNFFAMNYTPKTLNQFVTARFTITCSSGTYVRSLANELGQLLGTGAITLEILRTKIGEYYLQNAIRV